MIVIHNSIRQIDKQQWQHLLHISSCANFFQSQACFEFYSSLSFLKSFVFGVSENGILQAVAVGYIQKNGNVIKQYLSGRAIIPGGILLANDISSSVLGELLSDLIDGLRKEAIFLEIRNLNDYSFWKNDFCRKGFEYIPHLNIQIDTTDRDEVWKGLSKSKRRQIRLAEKNGTVCRLAKSEEDIKAFYLCLKKFYKTKVKTPLFPLEFFLKLAVNEYGRIFVIKLNEKIIGGIACVIFDKKCVYEWFVCGEDLEHTNNYPSVYATWSAINFAIENNMSRFDFMGAGSPGKSYGVREFKSKFGGKEVENGRFLYIFSPVKYKIGKSGIRILKYGGK